MMTFVARGLDDALNMRLCPRTGTRYLKLTEHVYLLSVDHPVPRVYKMSAMVALLYFLFAHLYKMLPYSS